MADELLRQIYERIQSLPDILSEQQIREIVESTIANLANDEEFQRKMRFGGGADQRLLGTKFYRYGLSLADVEFLYDMQTSLKAARLIERGPSEELENAFKHLSEAYYLPQEEVKRLDQRAIDNVFPRIPKNFFHGRDRQLVERGKWDKTEAYQRATRAMDTAETGYGLQLIGAQYVADLWEAARAQSRVFNTLETFEMTAPTAYLPVEADLPEMLFVPESTANNSSNYDTRKTGSNRVQVDAKKFVIHQMWSGEMEEDSIIPFIPFLRRQVVLSLAHYSDSVVLNGDTTNAGTGNINLDDADPADTKHYLAFDGLRHTALVDATAQAVDHGAAAVTFNALADAKSGMVDTTYLMDWGHPLVATDLIYVADPTTSDRIARLDEIINWKIQQGQMLISQPGQVGEILGHPVISSIAVSKTEADGKVSTTGSNNTLGQVVTYNRRAFVVGWRRRVKMETERLPATDQTRIVHSLRLGMGRYSPTGAASGSKAVRVLYNIDLS